MIKIFLNSNEHERDALWEELSKTEHLRQSLQINRASEGTKEWLDDELMVTIIKDSGNDMRDALLQIDELLNKARKYAIDPKHTLVQLPKLAKNDSSYGKQSMKDVFDNLLENNS